MLNNKVAIITGASSGIGRASGLLFARNGAAVIVGARRKAELDRLVLEITAAGGRALAVAGDVRDEAYALLLVASAIGQFGGLDIALNNAGAIGELGPSTGISTAGWNDTLATNLTSAFFGARAQIPAMLARGNGSLIFTATFVGHNVGIPQAAAYATSKSGVIGLMKALAAEYGPQGSACKRRAAGRNVYTHGACHEQQCGESSNRQPDINMPLQHELRFWWCPKTYGSICCAT